MKRMKATLALPHASPNVAWRVCARRSSFWERSTMPRWRCASSSSRSPSARRASRSARCCSSTSARSSTKHGAEVFCRRRRLMRSSYWRTTKAVATAVWGVCRALSSRTTASSTSTLAALPSSPSGVSGVGASRGTTKLARSSVHRMTPEAMKMSALRWGNASPLDSRKGMVMAMDSVTAPLGPASVVTSADFACALPRPARALRPRGPSPAPPWRRPTGSARPPPEPSPAPPAPPAPAAASARGPTWA